MADGDRYALLRLAAPRELARKKVRAHFPPPPPRVVRQHGRALIAGADAARHRMSAAAAISRDLSTPVPYLRIAPEDRHNVSDADLARLGLVPVMHRHDHVIAAYATDGQLGELRKKVAEYQRQTAKHDMLSRIATLGPWTRRDRESPRLAAMTLEPAASYIVDLMFLPFDDRQVETGGRAAVARFVQTSREHARSHCDEEARARRACGGEGPGVAELLARQVHVGAQHPGPVSKGAWTFKTIKTSGR
jgi:hypothetical protein